MAVCPSSVPSAATNAWWDANGDAAFTVSDAGPLALKVLLFPGYLAERAILEFAPPAAAFLELNCAAPTWWLIIAVSIATWFMALVVWALIFG